MLLALSSRSLVNLVVADNAILQRIADIRTAWLTNVMKAIGLLATGPAMQALWLVNLVIMVIWRRWRHLLVWLVTGLLVVDGTEAIAEVIQRPRPVGIDILGPWKGYAMPSLPLAVLAVFLVNTLYAAVPAGPPRNRGKLAVAGVLLLVLVSRLYLAQDAVTDAVFGVVIGITVPLVAFRLFVPSDVFPVTYRRGRTAHLDVTGRRHDAILHALEDQLGVIAIEIQPFGLEGSGGSTPLRVKVKGDPDYFLLTKLYSQTHVRSDRWYKLGRTLLYGRLEDEKPFNTVRRLVQYEDYALRLLHSAGLPVPRPYGIVEITPEREYLVVMEFFDGAREVGEAEVDDAIIDQGMLAVRRMWEAGLAHRDIKPANLMVRDGKLLVIDPAFAQVRPSPWRQAVDLANMMLVLALRTDAPRVLARARIYFDDERDRGGLRRDPRVDHAIAAAAHAPQSRPRPAPAVHLVASLPAADRQDPTMEHAPGHAQHRRHRRRRPRRDTGHPSHREQPAMRRIAALCCLLPLLAGCAGSISLGEPPSQATHMPSPECSVVGRAESGRGTHRAVRAERLLASLHQPVAGGIPLRAAGGNQPRNAPLAEVRGRGQRSGRGTALPGVRSARHPGNTRRANRDAPLRASRRSRLGVSRQVVLRFSWWLRDLSIRPARGLGRQVSRRRRGGSRIRQPRNHRPPGG